VGWWIRRKTELYVTRPFRPMWLQQVFFAWMESPLALHFHRRRKQKLLWNTNAGRGSRCNSVQR
jgi:hypothetical protein